MRIRKYSLGTGQKRLFSIDNSSKYNVPIIYTITKRALKMKKKGKSIYHLSLKKKMLKHTERKKNLPPQKLGKILWRPEHLSL